MPVVPLKDMVVFPFIIAPLSISSEASAMAVDRALTGDRIVLLLAQSDPSVDQPSEQQLHRIGTAATIMRMLKLPDGRMRVLVQGLSRARLQHLNEDAPFLLGRVTQLDEPELDPTLPAQAMARSIKSDLEKAVNLGKNISSEVMVIASNLEDVGRLADLAASNLDLRVEDAQKVLDTLDPLARLET